MNGDAEVTLKDDDPSLDVTSMKNLTTYTDRADQEVLYIILVYGTFSRGFLTTLIQTGTIEVVPSDSVRLYQAVYQAAIRGIYE